MQKSWGTKVFSDRSELAANLFPPEKQHGPGADLTEKEKERKGAPYLSIMTGLMSSGLCVLRVFTWKVFESSSDLP